jgi:hypothetical protein
MSDTLSKVIATIESGPFPYAMRFENSLWDHPAQMPSASIRPAMVANRCNAVTAQMICATSWGLFQIMGFNLYGSLGLTIAVGPYLFDTEQQVFAFNKFVRLNGFDAANFDFTDEALIERFARSYNGPGDVANYAAKMKAAYAALPKEA